MPKKFSTENTKAITARERKALSKEAEIIKKQQQQEDVDWEDTNKKIKKKQQRKEEQDKKREQHLVKKAETKALLEQEMSCIKSGKVQPPQKVTRAQIKTANSISSKKVNRVVTQEENLFENINRIKIEGKEAKTVTEAIEILNSNPVDVDKHPEKRMKAAYSAFECRRLEVLKLENPALRLSQLKQMIFKEWQKSPENPLNKQSL